jgi:hypothetical protein
MQRGEHGEARYQRQDVCSPKGLDLSHRYLKELTRKQLPSRPLNRGRLSLFELGRHSREATEDYTLRRHGRVVSSGSRSRSGWANVCGETNH